MQCLRRDRADASTSCPKQQGAKETTTPLDPTDPCSLGGFIAWTVSNHKSMGHAVDLKIEVPAKIFLTRLGVSFQPSTLKLGKEPLGYVIPEAARVDEITLGLGHVKGRTLERDNRSGFRCHNVAAVRFFPKEAA